jgi:WD40 repeat protein
VLATARAQDPEINWMHGGHTDQTTAVLFAPDSRTLVSGGLDGTIKVWDPASGRLLRSFPSEAGGVLSISLSRDGRLLAVGGVDGAIVLWDMSRFRIIRSYPGEGAANGVAIAPDGSFLVSAHSNGDVRMWDMTNSSLIRTLVGHTSAVNAVAVSPDSKWIATGSDDFSIILWSATDGSLLKKSVQSQYPTSAVAFSPNGQRLAATGADTGVTGGRGVVEYDLPGLNPVAVANSGHVLAILSIAYSADGRFVASVSEDFDVPGFILGPTIIVSDLTGAKRRLAYQHRYEHGYGTTIAFSPDGRFLAWGTSTGIVRMRTMAPEPDTLITVGNHYDISDHYKEVDAAAFSPVDGLLASASGDGIINLWQGGTGLLLRRMLGHNLGVGGLDFSRDGHSLASAGTDGSVRIWNVETGAQQSIVYVSAEQAASAVAFSADGRRIVAGTGFGDSTLGIWDTSKIDPIKVFYGHTGPITDVVYGTVGDQVISASEDGSVRVWNTTTGALDFLLDQKSTPYRTLALSNDGRTLAAGNADGFIRLWAMPSGDPLAEFHAHDDWINALSLSRDGTLLVSASRDRTVRVWDVAAREELHRYTAHPFEHLTVAINSDSGWVASGATDASIILWKLLTTSSAPERAGVLGGARMISAHPNPFTDHLRLQLRIPAAGIVDGAIYDLTGARIATIASGLHPAGDVAIDWNAADVPNGLYFYRITTPDGIVTGTVFKEE